MDGLRPDEWSTIQHIIYQLTYHDGKSVWYEFYNESVKDGILEHILIRATGKGQDNNVVFFTNCISLQTSFHNRKMWTLNIHSSNVKRMYDFIVSLFPVG